MNVHSYIFGTSEDIDWIEREGNERSKNIFFNFFGFNEKKSIMYAHDEYRSVLVDSRVGINQTPESIQSMNDLLVPLIRDKHQSIGHIYATHAEELGCSRRTLYSYINDCIFDIRNGDLRRSVRYKKRKKPTKAGS